MQQLEFSATAGLTLTATRRAVGTYTGGVNASSVTGQAGTNRYVAAFNANVNAAGLYRLDYFLSGVAFGSEVYELTTADGTFQPLSESPATVNVDLVDESAVALALYRRIAGGSVSSLAGPVVEGEPLDVVNSADFRLSIDVATAADSVLVFTVRRCAGDELAQLEADSDAGLTTVAGVDWPTASDAAIDRVSSSRVDVRINAPALVSLSPGSYTGELRELLSGGGVESRREYNLQVRRSAGRRIEAA